MARKKRRKVQRISTFAELPVVLPENGKTTEVAVDPMKDRLATSSIAGVLPVADENPDQILKKKGDKVYEEMEVKDGHLYAVYQTRLLAISLIPWKIMPANDSPRARELADFAFDVIDGINGPFCLKLKALLDAIGKGFSVLEICWKLIEHGRWKGKYGIDDLIFHEQRYWRFLERKHNKGINQDVIMFDPSGSSRSTPVEAVPVPWSKVIHYAFDGYKSLYGQAAFQPIFWYYWFKKEGWKSWVIYLNKYGMPTPVGKYPRNSTRNEKTALLDLVQSIQEETGIIIPEDMAIAFLEAARSGPASYEGLINACNSEESKAILGATQTVEEGKRGSYALSRTHSGIREERVEADGVVISDVIQQQLVKRVIDFNFITELYPQYVMTFKSGESTLKNAGQSGASPAESKTPAGGTENKLVLTGEGR